MLGGSSEKRYRFSPRSAIISIEVRGLERAASTRKEFFDPTNDAIMFSRKLGELAHN